MVPQELEPPAQAALTCLATRDNPPRTAPEKDDFRLRCQSSTDLSDLQRPTPARRVPGSACHGEEKRAFENTILGLHFLVGVFLAGAVVDSHWFDQQQVDTLRHPVLLLARTS